MNKNTAKALRSLSKFHDKRIYELGCECLYSDSSEIIDSAAEVIAGYSEYSTKSIELLYDVEHSASGKTFESILCSMWALDKDKATEFYLKEYRNYISSQKNKLPNFCSVIKKIDISRIKSNYKAKIKEMIHHITNTESVTEYIKKDLNKILNDLNK